MSRASARSAAAPPLPQLRRLGLLRPRPERPRPRHLRSCRPRPPQCRPWLPAAACALAFFVILIAPAPVRAQLYAPDPTSLLYETTALTAGRGITITDSQVTGNLQSNGNVDLDADSRVTGNVAATGRVHGRNQVTGSVQEGAPPASLPTLPTPAQARGLAHRVFTRGTTFTDAVIDDIVFVAGDARIHGSLNGTGTLIASGDIRLEAAAERDPPIRLDPATRMSLIAFGDLRLARSRPLRGLLLAGHSIELEGNNFFAGVLLALERIQLERGAVVTFAKLDQTPPVISALAPPDGSLLAKAAPTVSASFSDDLSGVDPGSFQLTFDGADRTASAQVSGSGFSFTPAASLADGAHTVAVALRDRAGNPAPARWSFSTDVTPPTLAFTAPSGAVAPGTAPPVALAYSDATSGVDPTTLRVSLDGGDLTASCTAGPASATCVAPALATGSHTLAAMVRDRAGNVATAGLTFQVTPPLPAVAITSPADGSYSRVASIQVAGTVNSVVTAVTVNGQPATLAQGAFTAAVTLSEGVNRLIALATDAAGNRTAATALVSLDTRPPVVTLQTPAPGQLTNQAQIRVAGSATDNTGIAALTVAGQPVVLSDGHFATTVPLGEGANRIEVDATDVAGNQQTVAVNVTRFSVPAVAITAPPDLSYVAATTVSVVGTAFGAATVSVNGVAASLSGSTFSAAGVPLVEGGNTVTATATDGQGHVGISTINLVRDLTPPHLAIYTPASGATLSTASATVAGLVNDIVAGTVNAGNVTVTVNGVPAQVANRSFLATGVPLQPGPNVLTAVAIDQSGNRAQASVTVQQAKPAGPTVAAISGSGQTAVIRTPLSQPLVAVLLDAAGNPVPGKTVLFRVRASDGTLDNGKRDIAVATDGSGQAQAHWTLGSRAGAGSQLVEATAVGFAGPALFLVSAQPGPPALIVVDSGGQQWGVAGQPLPRPLVAAVVDAGANRLPGVAVTCRVVKGAGTFANGQPTLPLTTDSDGRLIATLTTDLDEGVAGNVVEATIDVLPGGPVASFVASTWAAGDPALTAVSGVVLDNSNVAVAGVTLRIRDTTLTAVTDAQGQFQIAPAPVGTLKLIVDGSTAQRPGAWPDLEFDLTTVPGRNNTLRMPIYLLPLDLASGIQVDETHGGRLTLPELPGFVLEIQPGSVTFPGGGKSGMVSVTVVHSDKVPMVPNFGQQPRLIVTIQPAGARFDPPARLTMPNVEGLAPGRVTELYSFDHDLGVFVSIGPGTVSDDGSVITSNPGVGILKAGWHCCGFPQGTGGLDECPDCTQCIGDRCVPKNLCDSCTPGNACDKGGHCLTGLELIPLICDRLRIDYKQRYVHQCQDDPNGGPGFCGAVLVIDYTKVETNCDGADLVGTNIPEVVVSDHGCGSPPDFKPEQGGDLIVKTGNDLTGTLDGYLFCSPINKLPRFECTETYTQTQTFDSTSCKKVVTIKFTLTTTESGCSATVTRNP